MANSHGLTAIVHLTPPTTICPHTATTGRGSQGAALEPGKTNLGVSRPEWSSETVRCGCVCVCVYNTN